jgi:conjugative relaxase-like TrwC/TraI family protein
MLTIKAMTGGETYAATHLSNNDYYSVGETITGQWVGHGAELLGLKGEVTMEQFDAIRQSIDPATGEFLRPRVSADRYTADGEKLATARNLYDFTVSAPKAVSVQSLEDPRLVDAHKTAAAEAAIEIEAAAGSRIRRGGANDTRPTGNLVVARYDHDTSRELDPQLHTHLVAANLTYDGVEGRWKALQASDIYAQREFLSEVYRNALAREVMKLGYAIEDRQEHGKDRGFGIAGIPEATLEKYSRRSAQRDQAIDEFIEANGRKPNNNEIARIVRDSRPEKLYEVTSAEVKARQLGRMDPAEAQMLRDLRETATTMGSPVAPLPAAPSLDHARQHVFERLSVAKDHEVLTEALRHGRGRIEFSSLKVELKMQIETGAMLAAGGELATPESLARERRMVEAINEGIGVEERLGRTVKMGTTSSPLRLEQQAAIETVLESRDFAINLRGAAGTGKTATLQELKQKLTEARRSVVALAPTATAVEELSKVGFGNAMTITRFLNDPRQRDGLAGQVLMVDEAGMVASKDMAELIDVARSKNARVVFSGDTAQIKAVSEGDALRVLERESKLKSASLMQVQRQLSQEYKSAVETLRESPEAGYEKLERMGAIREADWRLRGQEVAHAYRQATAIPNSKGETRSVLVIAATHDEIKSITYAVRQDRKRAGELSPGETVTRHVNLNWTEAQKRRVKNYQPGQILEFHRAVKGVARNESLEVVSVDKASGVVARNSKGKMVTITQRQAGAYHVFERETIEVSAGDKLLLQENWRTKHFQATNGELVTVTRVSQDGITLEDGRRLPTDYRQFAHGYAVTAHRSQGKTVDYEIIAAERMSHDLFYVSATRAREGLTVVTSDSLTLRESIGVSGDRQSATELSERTATAKPRTTISANELFRLYQQQQIDRSQHQLEQAIRIPEIGYNHHVTSTISY